MIEMHIISAILKKGLKKNFFVASHSNLLNKIGKDFLDIWYGMM